MKRLIAWFKRSVSDDQNAEIKAYESVRKLYSCDR